MCAPQSFARSLPSITRCLCDFADPQSVGRRPVCLYVCFSLSLSLSLCVCVCVCVCVYLSVSLCICLCVYLFVCLLICRLSGLLVCLFDLSFVCLHTQTSTCVGGSVCLSCDSTATSRHLLVISHEGTITSFNYPHSLTHSSSIYCSRRIATSRISCWLA